MIYDIDIYIYCWFIKHTWRVHFFRNFEQTSFRYWRLYAISFTWYRSVSYESDFKSALQDFRQKMFILKIINIRICPSVYREGYPASNFELRLRKSVYFPEVCPFNRSAFLQDMRKWFVEYFASDLVNYRKSVRHLLDKKQKTTRIVISKLCDEYFWIESELYQKMYTKSLLIIYVVLS